MNLYKENAIKRVVLYKGNVSNKLALPIFTQRKGLCRCVLYKENIAKKFMLNGRSFPNKLAIFRFIQCKKI